MILHRIKIIAFLATMIFMAAITATGAKGATTWDFDGPRSSWKAKHTKATRFADGALVLKGSAQPRIVSPPELSIPSEDAIFTMRVKSSEDGFGIIRVRTREGVVLRQYWLRGGGEFHTYTLFLGAILPEGDRIEALALDFLARGGAVSIDRISIKAGSKGELLGATWSRFWEPRTVNGAMINSIKDPIAGKLPMMELLYIIIGAVFIISLGAIFVRRKPLTAVALLKATLIALTAASLLFAVRMDYKWLMQWRQDSATLSAGDDKRIFLMNAQYMEDYLNFLEFVKETVPEGARVRSARSELTDNLKLARYRLLPTGSGTGANYIWTYRHRGVYFNLETNTLMDGFKVVARNVVPLAEYAKGAAIYKLSGEAD